MEEQVPVGAEAKRPDSREAQPDIARIGSGTHDKVAFEKSLCFPILHVDAGIDPAISHGPVVSNAGMPVRRAVSAKVAALRGERAFPADCGGPRGAAQANPHRTLARVRERQHRLLLRQEEGILTGAEGEPDLRVRLPFVLFKTAGDARIGLQRPARGRQRRCGDGRRSLPPRGGGWRGAARARGRRESPVAPSALADDARPPNPPPWWRAQSLNCGGRAPPVFRDPA